MLGWAYWRLEVLCPMDFEKGDLAYDDIVLPYPDDYVEPEHVLHAWQRRDREGTGPRTMIISHRAGYWGPENSWKSLKRAMDLDVEGFEIDVWVTKDGVPIVHHGGPEA